MTEWLKALAAPSEDSGSVPSNHVAVYNCLTPVPAGSHAFTPIHIKWFLNGVLTFPVKSQLLEVLLAGGYESITIPGKKPGISWHGGKNN